MPVHSTPQALPSLGALHISGSDALDYLQGQLSADLRSVQPGQLAWAGLHSPQGRVLALLALAPVPAAPPGVGDGDNTGGDWLAVLPAALAEPAAAALRRFVLRARVRIAPSPPGALCLPASEPGADARALRHPGGQPLCWLPAGGAAPADAQAQAAWDQAEVALGLPQVYPQTSGTFVAQMLNLDCIGAIAFDKGCYTGQEVVARAHYRGRVKRRLQRFAAPALPLAPGGGELPPGSALRLADGRNAQLVRSARLPDGSVEFLAVCAWPAGDETAARPAGELAVSVDSHPLPLPYTLPE
ncbi:MAG: hypothetical protein RL684_134 [Pseudomonadota bacterium]